SPGPPAATPPTSASSRRSSSTKSSRILSMSRTLSALALFFVLATPALAADDAPPYGKGETLGERTMLEKTALCTDGKSHYVVVTPHEKQSWQLYYGDGKKFFHVPMPPWVISGESFFEPRFFAKTKNSNFRGLDMRMFASVDYDAAKKTCSVSC